MAEEIENLSQAFAAKEKNEKLLSNLDKLKAEGSIESDLYLSMKADYERQIDASLLEIDQIKGYFKKQGETLQLERDIYQRELAKLETRYNVGELPRDTYESSAQNLRATIGQLDQQLENLKRFVAAQSSADLGISAKRPAPAIKQAPPVAPPSAIPVPPLSTPPVPPPITSPVIPPATPEKQRKSPGRKWLAIIGGAIVLVGVIVLAGLLLVPKEDTSIAEVKIPVDIKGASNIGSLHFEMVYDTTGLTLTSVSSGALLGNAIFKYSSVPGRLVCGMVSSSGIKGDGSIIVITFQVLGKGEKTIPLTLENVTAYDGTSLTKLSLSMLNGSFLPRDGSFIPPSLSFAPASK